MNKDDSELEPVWSHFHETVLKCIGDGVMSINLDGRVSYLNPIAEQLTQWPIAEARGLLVEEVLRLAHEETREEIDNPAYQVLKTGESQQLPHKTLLIGRYGRETPISDSIAPILDAAGQITGAVLVFRSMAELRISERRFQDMIEQIADHVIVMTDPEGMATSWNQGVKDLLGYDEREFIGKHLSDLIFTDEAIEEGVPEWEFETAREGGSAIDDRWMKRSDGSHFWASGIMTVLRDEGERIIGYNKIMRDLTEEKTNNDAVRKLNYELTQAQRRKDDFIATLAHELRNPLSPVTAALTLMEDCLDDSHRVRELYVVIQSQVGQMVRLVEDLLDVSRIGQGKVRLAKVHCGLQPIVRQAVESCRSFIESSSQVLSVDMPAGTIDISVDSSRMVQVLTNILNNAAKYTPEGGKIDLVVSRVNEGVQIVVSDNGVGIGKEELKVVFDLFAQVNTELERGKSGLGIGLALVKRIIELHAGIVTIDSPGPGLGTTVTVVLPLAHETLSAGKASHENDATPSEMPQRLLDVLVVDDSRAITLTLGRLIEKLGHTVRTAASGEEALELTKVRCPHIVISDISMPSMDGYQLAREFRSHYGQSIMLVAMTGYSNEAARQRVLEAGFDQHMVKPPDVAQLSLMLESYQSSQLHVDQQQKPGNSERVE